MHKKTVNNSSGGIVTLDLRRWIIILLELPIVIFFLSWLNIFVGVAASALLIFADFLVLKNKTSDKMILTVEKKKLLILFVVALIWCWLGGIGGFFYQYLDHNWRNAIFHDLINYDWPVIYDETDRMLDYFIGVWLFPALVGKLFLVVGASATVAWYAANAVLLIYCSLCVFIVFCLIIKILTFKSNNAIIIAIFVFILFSGMDFFGIVGRGMNPFEFAIYEGWSGGVFQLQSMSTGLFWSYNQHPFAWIVILVILLDRDIKNLAFWGLLVLPYAPLPFVGIFLYAVCIAVIAAREERLGISDYFKKVFSVQNIIAVLSVGVIYGIYYLGNAVYESTEADSSAFMLSGASADDIKLYILFLAVEVLPFFVFTFKDNRKDPLLYLSLFILVVFPLIRVGSSMDFGMKATIPALVYMYILIVRKLRSLKKGIDKNQIKAKVVMPLLAVVLFIGSLTALIEPARAVYLIVEEKTIFLATDNLKTLDNPDIDTDNFTASDYSDSAFYRYISRK